MAIHIPIQCIERDDDLIILKYGDARIEGIIWVGVIGVVPSTKEIELLDPNIAFEVNEYGLVQMSKTLRDTIDERTEMALRKYSRVCRAIMTYLEQETDIPDNFAYNA